MRTKRLRIIAGIITLTAVLITFSTSALAYNSAAAQEYADKWVFSHNTKYRYFKGGDCTNFVSQCMKAGGLPNCNDWYYNNYLSYSRSFTVADDLKNYIKNVNKGELLGRWAKTTHQNVSGATFYGYVDNSANIAGYGSEIVFYDWEGDGKMDHASIIVGTNKPFAPETKTAVGDLVDAHTESRQHQYWHLDRYNKDNVDTVQIYCFRLNV